MPNLNIKFFGFWDKDEIIFEHYFKNSHRFLFEKYNVVINNETPDVVFCSVFNNSSSEQELFRHNCPKIMLIHENIRPVHEWFDIFDYIISFSAFSHERHKRIPYWVYRYYEHGLPLKYYQNRNFTKEHLQNVKTRFCNFIYSNPFFFRREFAHELSKYKQVDFAGKVDTNIPEEERLLITPSKLGTEGLKQKRSYLDRFKYTITFENSSSRGYTTEKILDAFASNSIPLYWGNPNILLEGFNRDSFLNYFQTPGNKQFIDRIKEIDSDDNKYLEMLNSNVFGDNPPEFLNSDYMLNLYEKMIERK